MDNKLTECCRRYKYLDLLKNMSKEIKTESAQQNIPILEQKISSPVERKVDAPEEEDESLNHEGKAAENITPEMLEAQVRFVSKILVTKNHVFTLRLFVFFCRTFLTQDSVYQLTKRKEQRDCYVVKNLSTCFV